MACTGCNGGCNDCGGLECGTGAAGLDGLNSFTTTTATFLQPAFGDPAVSVAVSALGQSTGLWGQVGQWIFIEGAGFFKIVTSTTTLLTVIVPSATIQTYNYTLAGSGATIAIGSGVSPAGVEGTAGAAGVGTDGVTVMFQNIGISSPATMSTSYSAAVFSNAPITIPANTLVDVGDMLRIEMTIQNDTNQQVAAMPSNTLFSGEVTFGGTQVWEGVIGLGNSENLAGGTRLSLDLIVSATNTLSMRQNEISTLVGERANQWAYAVPFGTIYSAFRLPPTDISGTAIGAISPTLTNSNAIVVNIKNSTNSAAHIASVTSMLVTKFKI